MQGKGVAVSLAFVLLASCSTAPDYRPVEGDPPPPRLRGTEPTPDVQVLVAEFARRHGLSSDYDSRRNRLELTGRKGEVVLFPGTSVATVNGRRVPGMGKVRIYNGTWAFRPEDAVRVERALFDSSVPATPSAAKARTSPRASTAAPDPAWRVPLRRQWSYVVIHHSGTATGCAAVFHVNHRDVRGWDGLGYHFVIGNGTGSEDGEVEVGYRWTRQLTGAHAGRAQDGSNLMNETGIGVCLVGDFDSCVPTDDQRESLHRLLGFLEGYCGIPADRVLLHRDLKVTHCPGRHFPEEEFLARRRDVPPR